MLLITALKETPGKPGHCLCPAGQKWAAADRISQEMGSPGHASAPPAKRLLDLVHKGPWATLTGTLTRGFLTVV